ncbi:MAG: tetratricopeptide repeat protein [Verrucomicrobiota bacterium]|nr:tetratricopeptide repeat protein [Verrucomicrobiota bacterium]
MAEVTLQEIPQRGRDLFNKGSLAFERGNLDYAIDLLCNCVIAEPRFLHGRKYLRAASIQRFKQKSGFLARLSSQARNLPGIARVMSMRKAGKHQEALALLEKMLTEAPLDTRLATLFAGAADALGMHEVAVQTLEIARDHHPDDQEILKLLGQQHLKAGQIKQGREIFEKLNALNPRDPDSIKALKDADALESLHKDGWAAAAEKGTYRDVIKSAEEAVLLERQAKAKKADTDLDALIEDTLKKLEQEPENINLCRALSRHYAEKKMFNEALGILEKAQELSPGDPELDNAWSAMRARKFDREIADLKAESRADEAAAKEQERDQFLFDDLQERVVRYPNDLSLRYDWGVKLFENDYVDEAIQEFQRAQRSPKHRSSSLYYLALCFKHKQQFDLAVEQLTLAQSEIAGMDDMKKDILYELGAVLDLVGRPEKAAEYYKQIYQVDIGYKDISRKIEKAYKK